MWHALEYRHFVECGVVERDTFSIEPSETEKAKKKKKKKKKRGLKEEPLTCYRDFYSSAASFASPNEASRRCLHRSLALQK